MQVGEGQSSTRSSLWSTPSPETSARQQVTSRGKALEDFTKKAQLYSFVRSQSLLEEVTPAPKETQQQSNHRGRTLQRQVSLGWNDQRSGGISREPPQTRFLSPTNYAGSGHNQLGGTPILNGTSTRQGLESFDIQPSIHLAPQTQALAEATGKVAGKLAVTLPEADSDGYRESQWTWRYDAQHSCHDCVCP